MNKASLCRVGYEVCANSNEAVRSGCGSRLPNCPIDWKFQGPLLAAWLVLPAFFAFFHH